MIVDATEAIDSLPLMLTAEEKVQLARDFTGDSWARPTICGLMSCASDLLRVGCIFDLAKTRPAFRDAVTPNKKGGKELARFQASGLM